MKKLITFLINNTAHLAPKWNGKVSFRLLCSVKRISVSKEGNAFLDQAEETKLYHRDFEATVYKYGKGAKNIILLHGWLGNSERWKEIVASMDLNEYSCYLIDAPGHGRSSGKYLNLELYRIFLNQQIDKLTKVHAVIGHSLGSLVTAYAYLKNTQLPVDRYVISGAPAGMQSIYDFFERVMSLNKKAIANMNHHIAMHVTNMDPLEIGIANFLQQVEQPVLIIHDRQDKICPIEFIEEASIHQNEVETFFTSGLGHDLKGDKVMERTISFLKS